MPSGLTTGLAATGPAWDVVPPALASGRVLIIDDNKAILAVLTRLLQHAGLTAIQTVSDAAEAVAAYQEFHPDLVLLDLHMPGLSGFEVLERLQARSQEVVKVPVVMLTGDQDQRNRTRALAMGASDFLNKPFDSMEVLLRVRARLETRSLELRLAEHNQELEARVASRTRELEESQLEMLQRLAGAAELRDDETGQHTQRVGAMAGRLALAAGLPPERADLIARAAPLHDIGKIGVPDAILRKPGKLTPEEFAEMRTHAAVGARILSGGHSELMQLAERIAHYHHERWDGAGYPCRLSGEAIPLEARIVAVVDFFDALTHERPYRGAVPVDRTLAMIAEVSGAHFDPAIARAFIQMIRSGGQPTCEEAA
ncbi:MAG: response regulator [Gemmatimonadetes bacterium]|nr:response regulator [Gemmatimonadota bacterium]